MDWDMAGLEWKLGLSQTSLWSEKVSHTIFTLTVSTVLRAGATQSVNPFAFRNTQLLGKFG